MLICIVDTDVVGLAVFVISHDLDVNCVRLAFETGKSYRYLPANVPCLDSLQHCIQLCWTWKEDSMVNMEVTAGTNRCTRRSQMML